jgi:hypothetical protein
MPLFSRNKIERINDDIVAVVSESGRMKHELPKLQRGWCNELGVTVLQAELGGAGKLEVGRGRKVYFRATRNEKYEPWEVKHYENGDWEQEIKAVAVLTSWIYQNGGMNEDMNQTFDHATSRYKSTGDLAAFTNLLFP